MRGRIETLFRTADGRARLRRKNVPQGIRRSLQRLGDFNQGLSGANHVESGREHVSQEIFQVRVGRIAAAQPQDLWRRTRAFEPEHKVCVFGENNCIRVSRRLEDLTVLRGDEAKVTSAESLNAEFFCEPRRERGRQLSVYPDDQATSTG